MLQSALRFGQPLTVHLFDFYTLDFRWLQNFVTRSVTKIDWDLEYEHICM